MANPEHMAKLQEGVEAWNAWRKANPEVRPDLIKADLRGTNLQEADLQEGNLSGANLSGASLLRANLSKANLQEADISEADLSSANLNKASLSRTYLCRADLSGALLNEAHLGGADLSSANLSRADFSRAYLRGAKLSRAKLIRADLLRADLRGAYLSRADLSEAYLDKADLSEANLSEANLSEADLQGTVLIETNLEHADLTNCRVYGISAWNLNLRNTKQTNLVITPSNEPVITVDDLEVAQFIYLLLRNKKIRHVIDTITSKVVLILGRFTEERKAVLDAIREELRRRDFTPVLFDFEKPASKDLTGTVETLARMARFIIVDLTDPSSVPHELATVVPFLRTTPVLPLRLVSSSGYSMFEDLRQAYGWVLKTYEYEDSPSLISALPEVIAPVEEKARKLRKEHREQV